MFKVIRARMFTVGMALVLPATGWGDVNFSQRPLAAGGGVDPNLMFLLDDSGSMTYGFMPDGLLGSRYVGSCSSTVVYGSDELCSVNVGSRPYLLSSTYNKMYYDPDVTYSPPLKADGSSYPQSNFFSAPIDGFDSSSARVDLSDSFRAIMDDSSYYYGRDGGRNVFGVTISPYGGDVAAFYYEWKNSCSESNKDNLSCYTKVDITGDAERQSFANWYSFYRKRELAAKSGIGTVFANPDLSSAFRLGWGRINKGSGTVDDASSVRSVINGVRPFDTVKGDFLSWLYGVNSSGGTPLRTALEGAGQYYEKSQRAWLDDPAKSFSGGNEARECRIAATMLMTDGYYSTGSAYAPELTSYADDVDGDEITNSAGDSGKYEAKAPFSDSYTSRVSLADIAAYYWKRDLRTDIANFVPVIDEIENMPGDSGREQVGDPAFWQHMMTYGIGFGVTGTVSRNDAVSAVLDGTSVSWWGGNGNEDKINDLLHASMNGRGDFFSAGNPTAFKTQLGMLLNQFLGSAGSATGVDFNVASIEADDALVFSSYFDPNGWSGDLTALTLVSDADGLPTGADPADNTGWSAREVLDSVVPEDRSILTYNGSIGQPFRWNSLAAGQQADLNTGSPSLGELRLEYLRGKSKATIESENSGKGQYFRQRAHLLGSIVNSTPRYTGKPDSNWPNSDDFGDGKYSVFQNTEADRTPVVYVGANDGMLHGFKATAKDEGGGDEVIGYVPSFVSSTDSDKGLHYLTKPGYEHRYYVDLNLEVVDVFTKGRRDNGNVDPTRAWRTVLIGGSRAGAKGIFALDVTDPDSFSEDNAAQHVLWEFTHDKLGYLVEPPEIAQMEWPDGNIRWTVFVPSGYNSGSTGFFMLDLEAGLDGSWGAGDYMYHEFKAGGTGLSPLTVIDNLGNNHLVDRVYAGDLDGNLWVAEIKSGSGVQSAYGASPYFKADQPITSAPGVSLSVDSGKDPDLMILFGTGKYLENTDHTNTDTQAFYAVHETSDAGSLPLTKADLVAMPVTQQSGSIGGASKAIRVASTDRVDYQLKRGWFTTLPTSGERIVNYPVVRGEYVYVNTLIPGVNPCLGGGDGWVMAFEIIRKKDTVPDYPAFEDSSDNASGFNVSSAPSQLSIWGNLLSFGSGNGGAEFTELPEIIAGLGRKGWREITE